MNRILYTLKNRKYTRSLDAVSAYIRQPVGLPRVPLGQGLSTLLPVRVWGQSMALLRVSSQKRVGGGGSAAVGSAVAGPPLSSNGSLPSRGSAPAAVESPCPLAVDAAVAATNAVVLGAGGEAERPSPVGAGEGKEEEEGGVRALRVVHVLERPIACGGGGTATLWSPVACWRRHSDCCP